MRRRHPSRWCPCGRRSGDSMKQTAGRSAGIPYWEQLRHPNWQRKRLEKLEAVGWTCERCEATDITLNVHHPRYFKGRMPWEYADDELQVLCEKCHKQHHEDEGLLARAIAGVDYSGDHRAELVALALFAGFARGDFRYGDPPADVLASISAQEPELVGIGKLAALIHCHMQEKHWPALAALLTTITQDSFMPGRVETITVAWVARLFGRKP